MAIKAIETTYKGYRFPSRLEARWAVFFGALGVEFDYEPQGFDLDGERYLPDFWLPEQECWIEIKGDKPSDRELDLASRLAAASGHRVFVFPGPIIVPSDTDWYHGGCFPPDGVNGAYLLEGEGGDQFYCWCECPICLSVGLEFEGRSDRLPCKQCISCAYGQCGTHPPGTHTGCVRTGGNLDKGYNANSARLIAAYTKARQARFEHGETP